MSVIYFIINSIITILGKKKPQIGVL